jgi:hypothetical protein
MHKNHLKVLIGKKIVHCITDHDPNFHLVIYRLVGRENEHAIPKTFICLSISYGIQKFIIVFTKAQN